MSDAMREKIAAVVASLRAVDYDEIFPNDYETADAIIAALPGMVPPLVWVDSYGVRRAETPWGAYRVSGRILTLPLPMNPQQVHADECEAKAAANTHYVAQIMQALGIAQEDRTDDQ